MIQWSHYSLDNKRDRLNIEDCILNTGIAMKRIGVAASKMAKGNLVLYNCYVVHEFNKEVQRLGPKGILMHAQTIPTD